MATGDPRADGELQAAVRKMQALKDEHRGILARVAQDPGMSPETRWTLIEHLSQEEDEHLTRIALLAASPAAPQAVPDASPSLAAHAATVGSLRPVAQASATSVGSLRREPGAFRARA